MAKKSKNLDNMEKRGTVWYFRKAHNGKLYHERLSENQTEAINLRDNFLYELRNFGSIQSNHPDPDMLKKDKGRLFGEVALEWVAVHEVEASTMKDYKSAMNTYILPAFGNRPIADISRVEIVEFRKDLPCSNKRKNNILVPFRCVLKFAEEEEIIEKNPMKLVKNLKAGSPDIYPLSMDEVIHFLDCVDQYYRDFFAIAFFTGMRFGEMAVLKWHNVDLNLGFIKVRETRVRGVEKIPKTDSSYRDIRILPPVRAALESLKQGNTANLEYVFSNRGGHCLLPGSINYHVWKPALEKAGFKPRSLYQTRHTFATLMLDSGEHPAWVQRMMGHKTMKMILERYYKHIKNYQHEEGSAFMKYAYSPNKTLQAEIRGVPET